MTTIVHQPHIHPTALVDSRAEIHPETEIGPYVIIDGPVRIGRSTRVMAYAHLTGWTEGLGVRGRKDISADRSP
jgi:UDP-N-acetylglucosamine acyltransferase